MDAYEPRFYVRHYDELRTHGEYMPAVSIIRDRFYCHRDVRRFRCRSVPKKRIRPTVYYTRTTAEMRAWVEEECARWNAEDV